mgnify:FL=1
MEEKAGKLCFLLYKSRKTGKIKEKLSKTGGNDLKICMKCKRAFEDEKKVCDFCGEPLIEIRETDGVKKERIKKNPMAFAVIGIAIALVAGLGIGSLTMKQLVTGKNEKSAVQGIETDEENVLGEVKKEKGVSIEDEEEETDEDEVPEIKVGETWTVDGLWKVTINSVTETEERHTDTSYDGDKNPEAVYIVDYTYENLGYKSDSSGLGIDLSGVYSQIVDSDKEMGYSYYVYVLSKLTSPDYVPVGARMTAQVAIGVNHKGTFSILYEGRVEDRENLYDSKIYRVKFICEVKE